jgi:hypothetical protein
MILVYNKAVPDYAGAVYIALLSFPFWMPTFGRWLFLDITWDQKIMGWFRPKKPNNVVPFPGAALPEPKGMPPMPYVEPPKPKDKPAQTLYTIGVNSENRLVLRLGTNSEINMNEEGVNMLIGQLEMFRNSLYGKPEDN